LAWTCYFKGLELLGRAFGSILVDNLFVDGWRPNFNAIADYLNNEGLRRLLIINQAAQNIDFAHYCDIEETQV
jgi:hypothetical protein